MSNADKISAKWMKAARARVNDDPAFRKRGTTDTKMALKVGRNAWLITFHAFSCQDVRSVAVADLRDADFVVEFDEAGWQRFVEGRRRGDGPGLAEVDLHGGIVRGPTPRAKIDFLRYHGSLQAFLDAGIAAAAA